MTNNVNSNNAFNSNNLDHVFKHKTYKVLTHQEEKELGEIIYNYFYYINKHTHQVRKNTDNNNNNNNNNGNIKHKNKNKDYFIVNKVGYRDTKLDLENLKEELKQLGISDDEWNKRKTEAYKAKEKLFRHNINLVFYMVRKYFKSVKNTDFEDVIQAGLLGLNIATEKYNCHKDYKFSTFAFYWIRHHILRLIQTQDSLIRIPVHKTLLLNKLRKDYMRGEQSTLSIDKDELENILNVTKPIYSLNSTIKDETDTSFMDFIADRDSITPELYAEIKHLSDKLINLLNNILDHDQRTIILLKYGFDDRYYNQTLPLTQIASITKLNLSTVKSKYAIALRKLRASREFRDLYTYLNIF